MGKEGMRMVALSCSELSLAFGDADILRDVTFSVNEGDRVGIVGVNGAGKSSLLKLITGSLPKSGGSVYFAKDKTMAMLEQGVLPRDSEESVTEVMLGCFPSLLADEKRLAELQSRLDRGDQTAAESYASLHDRFTRDGGYAFRGRCKGLLRSLGFTEEDALLPVRKLSGGQKTRLALGQILFREPDLLILDEPTNHLDMETLSWLEGHLRDYKKTLLVVSHDRYFLDRVTTKILDIENTHAKLYDGNYSVFTEKKKKDREIQERHYRNQQREIARIEAYIEQQKRWNRERNIIAAESRQKQLDKMERVEKPENAPEEVRLRFCTGYASGDEVLDVKGLRGGYNGQALFSGMQFEVRRGDRLLITGHNGCGKSTLLKILTGRISPMGGSYRFGYNVNPGYYDQENQNLVESNTVLDELWDAYADRTQTEVRSALALMGFTGDDVFKRVSELSGGERARLTLCKLSLSETNLLILDEPTNHLDIGTREVLEEALSAYDGTVVAVSHDRYFVRKLATHILDFRKDGEPPFFFRGGYEDYLAYNLQAAPPAEEQTAPAMTAAKQQYLENKKKGAEERHRQKLLRDDRAEVERIEARLDAISNECEENASDHLRLTALYEEQTSLEERLLFLYEELEQLEAD